MVCLTFVLLLFYLDVFLVATELSIEVSSLNNTMTMISSAPQLHGAISFVEEHGSKGDDDAEEVPVSFTKEENDQLRDLPKKECETPT